MSDAGTAAFALSPTLSPGGGEGVSVRDTESGLAGDSGVALGTRLTLTTVDAGTEPVIGRVGLAPPNNQPTPVLPTPRGPPFRIEVTHLEALAGGGIGFPGTPEPVSPLISLDLALTFNHRLRLGVLGAFDFGGSTNVLDERSQLRGRLTTFGFVAAPSVTVCLDTAVRLCGGALAGTRVVQGNTDGNFIFGSTKTAWSAAFTVGPTLQATLIASRFHLALDASLLVTPTPPTFRVTGLPTELAWPVAQGLVRLSVGVGSL